MTAGRRLFLSTVLILIILWNINADPMQMETLYSQARKPGHFNSNSSGTVNQIFKLAERRLLNGKLKGFGERFEGFGNFFLNDEEESPRQNLYSILQLALTLGIYVCCVLLSKSQPIRTRFAVESYTHQINESFTKKIMDCWSLQKERLYPFYSRFRVNFFTNSKRPASVFYFFENENQRALSFVDLKESSPISIINLAHSGFYYVQKDGLVKCSGCGKGIKIKDFSEEPSDRKFHESASCPFVLKSTPSSFQEDLGSQQEGEPNHNGLTSEHISPSSLQCQAEAKRTEREYAIEGQLNATESENSWCNLLPKENPTVQSDQPPSCFGASPVESNFDGKNVPGAPQKTMNPEIQPESIESTGKGEEECNALINPRTPSQRDCDFAADRCSPRSSMDVSSAIEHHGNMSSGIEHHCNSPSSIEHHGNLASATEYQGNPSSVIEYHGNRASTIEHQGNMSSATEHNGNTSSGIEHQGNTSSAIEHQSNMSPAIEHHGNMSSATEHNGNMSSATEHRGNTSSGIKHQGNTSSAIEHQGNTLSTSENHRDISAATENHDTAPSATEHLEDTPTTIEQGGNTSSERNMSSAIEHYTDTATALDHHGVTTTPLLNDVVNEPQAQGARPKTKSSYDQELLKWDKSSNNSSFYWTDMRAFEPECFFAKSDVKSHAQLKWTESCEKNEIHDSFFPIAKISISQLPEPFQSPEFHQVIISAGNLTVQLRVTHTSPDRPDDDWYKRKQGNSSVPRYGSGCALLLHNEKDTAKDMVKAFQENSTKPKTKTHKVAQLFCHSKGKPAKSYFCIQTAKHLVFDNAEAKHTEVFFEIQDATTRNVTRYRCKGKFVIHHKAEGNYGSVLLCKSSEPELLLAVERERQNFTVLCQKLPQQIMTELLDYCFVISHPHGLNKMVTFGQSTIVKYVLGQAGQGTSNRKLERYYTGNNTTESSNEDVRELLMYTAGTCRGSSGGPVFWSRNMRHSAGANPTTQFMMWIHNGVEKESGLSCTVMNSYQPELTESISSSTKTTTSSAPPTNSNKPDYSALGPHALSFVTMESRLASFKQDYESQFQHSALELAEAGFYYKDDCVKCFCCGLTLIGWNTTSDIQAEHKRRNPNCRFLKAHKYNLDKEINQVLLFDETQREESFLTTLLKSERKKLLSKLTCKVCWKYPACELFLACGDVFACDRCSQFLYICPVCGKDIYATVTAYLA